MQNRNYIFILILIIFSSCKKYYTINDENVTTEANVRGVVQKGPFIIGSTITLYDLKNLSQTGRSFTTQIADNTGSFSLNGVSLSSDNVLVQANGYYFNEVINSLSIAPISLFALAKVSDTSSLNVNLLTNLEKDRILYLMSNNSLSYEAAQTQAQHDILSIFFIDTSINPATNLNINQPGSGNGILLAVSAILGGNTTPPQLTEILAGINLDVKEDGVLNSQEIYKTVLQNSIPLDSVKIKANLVARYNEIGASPQVPQFGSYIDSFLIKASRLTHGTDFLYPTWSSSIMTNLLSLDDSVFSYRNDYPFTFSTRILDTMQNHFKIGITLLNGTDSSFMTSYDFNGPVYPEHTAEGYRFVITPTFDGLYFEHGIFLVGDETKDLFFKLEYFENDFINPKRTRIIKLVY